MKRASIALLASSIALCSSVALAGNPPAPVVVTGQTSCYADDGTAVSCTGTGQDGEVKAGYPFPAGRFTTDSHGFVTDNLTGLMWMVAPSDLWDDFQDWYKFTNDVRSAINTGANGVDNGGYTDWRAPNINEVASLINYGQENPRDFLMSKGFPHDLWSADTWWSSTTNPASAPSGGVIEAIDMYYGSWYNHGDIGGTGGQSEALGVFVRDGKDGLISLPKTGQQASYNPHDDGNVQKGVAWPSPRFTTVVNQTLTDNLTGLMWSQLGNLVMSRDPDFDQDDNQDGKLTWSHALAYIKKLNAERYLGYSDWRLPNINELRSLYNAGAEDNIGWLNSQGFQNIQDIYWTSSSAIQAANPNQAWTVSYLSTTQLGDESVTFDSKNQYTFHFVLPVRRVLHGTVETVLTPTTAAFCSPGGAGSTAVEAGGAWSASAADNWVSFSNGSGTGDGSVTFNVAANASGAHRSSTVTVDGKTVTVLQAKAEFNDVKNTAGNWAYPYACAIYAKGITQGCDSSAPAYCPDNSVTREQMAAFIVRAKFSENFTISSNTPYYNDVDSGSVYFRYIQKMREAGLAAPNASYNPAGLVTREQMAAFIIRALQGENFTYTQTPYFGDVSDTSVFYKYVQKMKDLGLTANNGFYDAAGYVTRAQMAAFLSRAFLGMK